MSVQSVHPRTCPTKMLKHVAIRKSRDQQIKATRGGESILGCHEKPLKSGLHVLSWYGGLPEMGDPIFSFKLGQIWHLGLGNM